MLLYPPTIEGQLPPAVLSNQKIMFTIPYQINKGTNPSSIVGYVIKIKNLISDKLLLTQTIDEFQTNEIQFEITKDKNFNLSDHYKIQVAFIDTTETIGYFSTVGVCKLISVPTLQLNQQGENWIGTYTTNDFEDLLYSSYFVLKDENGQIIEQSENKLTNYLEQNQGNQNYTETYRFKHAQKTGYNYTVEWHIETMSGYKAYQQEESVIKTEILNPDYQLIPIVRFNEENGCAELAVKAGPDLAASDSANYGCWVITKASSKDNFSSWVEIFKIENFYSWYLSKEEDSFDPILIKDYNIEHGVEYQYGLQQVNNYGLYSLKVISPIVLAKFEDMYLCDEERQLRIAFNPKVSSMKNNILESKQDTIGGKHPYIFRNGQIKYKEFSISGLISYLEDPTNEFKVDYGELNEFKSTDLTHSNFSKERQFKLEVLDWLNNGKTKLLKTTAEGNYLVRLLNVSLQPTDTVGRMLHTFSATAIEIEDNEFEAKMETIELLNESSIKVTTLTETSLSNLNQQHSLWYEKNIKELWFYGDSRAEYYTVTLRMSNGKTIDYNITQNGLRIQFYDQGGIQLTSITYQYIEFPDEDNDDIIIVAPPNINLDVYYTNTPVFKANKSFSNTDSITLKEVIGTEKFVSGTYFYKILTVNEIVGNLGLKDKEINNVLTYTNTRGEQQKLLIIDSLTLKDIIITDLVLGSNLECSYCYVGPDNYLDIIIPDSPI